MNRKNIFQKYLFRKDFFWKVKEKLYWFIRNNSRNAYKDQRVLLKNLESGIILDVGAHIGDTVKLYQNYFPGFKIFLGSSDNLIVFINPNEVLSRIKKEVFHQ